ncbi:hypothetical protein ACFSJ3_03300 [Corallincola platygyrae]|uniref:Uncharacterized protein n=1 Tax=Corallincola platygyrae TaxID=1193278 RepID=A0ABW4XHI7_9GAMM
MKKAVVYVGLAVTLSLAALASGARTVCIFVGSYSFYSYNSASLSLAAIALVFWGLSVRRLWKHRRLSKSLPEPMKIEGYADDGNPV